MESTAKTHSSNNATILGIVARVVSLSVRLISLPVTLLMVTTEEYGLWLVVLSFIGWLSISDFGVPSALQNQLTILAFKEDEKKRQALMQYSLMLLVKVGVSIAMIGTTIALLVPWSTIANVPEKYEVDFKWSLIICLLSFSFALPSRIANATFYAHGKLGIPPLVDIITQLVGLCALLVAYSAGVNSIQGLAFCSLISIILVPFLFLLIALRQFEYRFDSRKAIDPEDRRHIVKKGGYFFFTTLGELLILQSDALLISKIAGPSVVASYMIPWSLFIMFQLFQTAFLRPLWPSLTRDNLVGAEGNIRNTIKRMLRISVVVSLCGAIGLIIYGDQFLLWWTSGAVGLPIVMALGLGVYAVVASVDGVYATALNAFGLVEKRMKYTLAFGFLKVALGIVVLQKLGVSYLPAVFALAISLSSVPWAIRAVNRHLQLLKIAATGPR